ncbi:hypothetical protein [Parapedobacter koreensis]|uniref:Uncharacterized protein n=1 Tax=Parapedobacter koreensis TaxID=332977 RepID=A0A1H7NY92_9SPHI|nr:hypothetical protein [Parapedobacter koreensis]SEL27995.1 hypothetical protein SAMN05421740_104130 [Parapedobacter koreensis]
MAIKKESAQVSADSKRLRDKKGDDLIRARHDLKEKKQQKNYEAGIDPQDEQFNTMPDVNTMPDGTGESRGDKK